MSEIIRDPEEQNNILRGFKEDMEKGSSTESGTIDRRYERDPKASVDEPEQVKSLLSEVKRLRKDIDDEFIISLLQGIECNCEDDYTRKKVKKHMSIMINAKRVLNDVVKRIAE